MQQLRKKINEQLKIYYKKGAISISINGFFDEFEAVRSENTHTKEEEATTLTDLVFLQITTGKTDELDSQKAKINLYLEENNFPKTIKSDLQFTLALIAYNKGNFKVARDLLQECFKLNPKLGNPRIGHRHLLLGKVNWRLGHCLFSILHYFKAYSYFDETSIWRPKTLELIARLQTEMLNIQHPNQKARIEGWLDIAKKQLESIVEDYKTHPFYFSIENHRIFLWLEIARKGLIKEFRVKNMDIDILLEDVEKWLEEQVGRDGIIFNAKKNRHQAALERNRGLFNFIHGRILRREKTRLNHALTFFNDSIAHCKEGQTIRKEVYLNEYHPTIGRNFVNQSSTYYEKYLISHKSHDLKMALRKAQKAIQLSLPNLSCEKPSRANPDYQKESLEITSNYNLIQAIRCKINALMQEDTLDIELIVDTLKFGEHVIAYIRRDFKSESANLLLSSEARRLYESALNALFEIQKERNTSDIQSLIFHFFENSSYYSIAPEFIEDTPELGSCEQLIVDAYDKIVKNHEKKSLLTFHPQIDDVLDKEFESSNISLNPSNKEIDRIPTIKEVQNLIDTRIKNGTAVISYFIGEEHLYVHIIIKDGKPRFLRLADNKEQVDEIKEHIHQLLTVLDNYENTKKHFVTIINLRHQLSKKLIAPISSYIESAGFLLIIPDNELAKLPFEVLESQIRGKDNYLIEDFYMSYHYSIVLLYYSIKNYEPPKNSISYKFVGIGSNIRVYMGEDLLPIDNAYEMRAEIKQIERKLEQYKIATKIFLDSDESFNKENRNKQLITIKRAINKANIVHIACHEQEKDDDEIYLGCGFKINARNDFKDGREKQLLILNACKSSGQQLINGEGLKGLGRAFLKNRKIKNIIYTLSNIPDKDAKKILSLFYTTLLGEVDRDKDKYSNHSIAVALGKAKRKFIEESEDHGKIYLVLSHIFIGNPMDTIKIYPE